MAQTTLSSRGPTTTGTQQHFRWLPEWGSPRVLVRQQHRHQEHTICHASNVSGSSSSNSTTTTTLPSSSSSSRRSPLPVQTPAISVSGPYLATSSIDSDSMLLSADFLARELVGPYKFNKHQVDIIHELAESMKGCSTAFVAVAVAGIALTLAAGAGMEMDETPEVLFNGVTVGDVASWVDSLLVAYLLRYGASSFSKVEARAHEEKQLAYTFQGINRLGLMFNQFSIAAATVSIVTTLEAASKWPPLVSLASGLFFIAAVARSGAMWYVLRKYCTTLDDVGSALEAQRRAYAAAHDDEVPLADRLAIRLAFSYLLQYSDTGRQAIGTSLTTASAAAAAAAAAAVVAEQQQMEQPVSSSNSSTAQSSLGDASTAATAAAAAAASAVSAAAGHGAGSSRMSEQNVASAAAVGAAAAAAATGADADVASTGSSAVGPSNRFAAATAAAAEAMRTRGMHASVAAAEAARRSMEVLQRVPASEAARKSMEVLQRVPLPIISRSSDEEGPSAMRMSPHQQEQEQQYELTQAEERLLQACQSSLNNAGLALVFQAVATGLLVTANMANSDYSSALADGIQVVNKAVAAELIFIATTNFDKALYTEGCDVAHLLEGLGHKGISKLFHNLSILAWAVVIAKGVELLAPWEESSPLFKFISENFSHRAADVLLEGQELLVNLLS